MVEPGDAGPRFDHERSDVSARVPAWTVLVTVIALAVSLVLITGLMSGIRAPATPGPDVFGPDESPRRAPPLQHNPPADLDRLTQRWHDRLHSFGWVDREAGIVHIPIDTAMDRIAEQGLPGAEPGTADGGQ